MDALLVKRRVLKGQVTRLEKALAETEDLSPMHLQLYEMKIDKLERDLDALNENIVVSCGAEAFSEHETEYNSIVERIERLKIFCLKREENVTSNRECKTMADIKLPKLELPVFVGRYEEWLPFHDLFSATVHNNAALSDARKFHYLKSSVKGEAALLIQAIPVTDANYSEAWDILMNRFNNSREIIEAHMTRLFNQPKLNQESATALRQLLDTTTECCRSLKVLKVPVEHWDVMLVYLLKGKMDPESRRQWELSLKGNEQPSLKTLETFLEQRSRALAASQVEIKGGSKVQFKTAMVSSQISTGSKCAMCKGSHSVHKCQRFLQLSVAERKQIVRQRSLCFNCLKSDHHCRGCESGHCRKCNGRHHTLLHQEQMITPRESEQTNGAKVTSHLTGNSESVQQVFLATAVVLVKDEVGKQHRCRALLDSASQTSFITERCAQRLQLKRQYARVSISGIGSAGAGMSRGAVTLIVQSRITSHELYVEALVISQVTKPLPHVECNVQNWLHLSGLELADPSFCKPGEVDILLGADVFAELLAEGYRRGPKGIPSAFNTVFGWVISGAHQSSLKEASVSVHHACSKPMCNLDTMLQRLWEIEEMPKQNILTSEEKACERSFESSHTRTETGRYTIRLPFQDEHHRIGFSREIAVRRFARLERRIQTDVEFGNQYREFMNEYQTLGHMEVVPASEAPVEPAKSFYLPHHAVFRESSTTTKLRVVFDASAKSSTGISLNDELLAGPKLQEDLLNILLRFRLHPVALCADIAKMYRQIWVHPDDLNFQRIIWRSHPNEPLQDYRLLTVTYGMKSAPYLATKVLQQLAEDERSHFPKVASILANDFYMDDLLTGTETTQEGLEIKLQLELLLQKGGFELRKWVSNDSEIMSSHLENNESPSSLVKLDVNGSVTSLGLHWKPASDHLSYVIPARPVTLPVTKRTILADTMKVFDPLGLLSPVVIRAKLILQKLWLMKLDWDEEVTDSISRYWQTFLHELTEIKFLEIPRCISQKNVVSYRLHGFCDASEKAYAAVVYLWTKSSNGTVAVQLIVAKTRVAPLKTVSLPRLELCGAVLLAKLMKVAHDALKVKLDRTYAWSDSMIVLAWLSSSPQRWKTFVANRVAEVQESSPTTVWGHVKSEENPADCASRGISVNDLQQHVLWWNGPAWLSASEVPKTSIVTSPEECLKEEKSVISFVSQVYSDKTLLSKYSSLTRLQRVTAYVLRFICNLKSSPENRRYGPLTYKELDSSLLLWIKVIQHEHFLPEINDLQQGKPVSKRSKVFDLRPFLDKGILRVGGRLRNSNLTPDQIHPIVLPKKSCLTELLIDYEHKKHLHGGPQLVLAALQRRFWILGARDAIRFHIRRCVPCFRQQTTNSQQVLSDLPAARVRPARPFYTCGVDYAGPILLHVGKGRGQKTVKGYIAIFVCFSTRAIHLELVSDMTTDAFLAALKRFVSRRGICASIHSDCGTNFVGASRELKEYKNLIKTSTQGDAVTRWLSEEGIQWHFNPPSAPHFGGLWEAGVKSVKFHLKRVMGSAKLTFEEMFTLLCQVEACLNSRPLTQLSNDPSNFSALTPGHFLIGDALTAVPEPDLTDVKENRMSRWQRCQRILQHFWKRWSREYLSRLQQRPKWAGETKNFQIGDLVLLKEELPPTQWKLGRVTQLHQGTDNFVRVVTVKTVDGIYKRPIVKLCRLPID